MRRENLHLVLQAGGAVLCSPLFCRCFGVGIHNTLEAAVYGIPVIFGPKYQKFNEAVSLIREGGAFSISNGAELPEILDSLIQHPAIAETAGQKALEYVNSQLGATAVISEALSTTI